MSASTTEVLKRLDTIEDLSPHLEAFSAEVSNWTVGQQVDHVISATSAFSVLLLREKKSDGSAEVSPLKGPILTSGVFPRGVVKAPVGLDNPSQLNTTALSKALLKCRNRVVKLNDLPMDAVATHHLLGEMTRDEVIRFLTIHLDHHLAIIRDILAKLDVDINALGITTPGSDESSKNDS